MTPVKSKQLRRVELFYIAIAIRCCVVPKSFWQWRLYGHYLFDSGRGACIGGAGGLDVMVGRPFSYIRDISYPFLRRIIRV